VCFHLEGAAVQHQQQQQHHHRDVSEMITEVQKADLRAEGKRKMVNTRVELATLALLAPRSNQLS
jgi:hypothetical protein